MTTLKVQRRNMETKAKKLRREGYVTGNLFGKEFEGSIPLQIEKGEASYSERVHERKSVVLRAGRHDL